MVKLNPGERSILASFESGGSAEKACAELKQAGITEVQFDHVGGFGYGAGQESGQPAALRGKESSLVNAVLQPQRLSDETAVLLGATNEASGMAGAPTQTIAPFLVTVVTSEGRVEEAVKVLQKHGGRV